METKIDPTTGIPILVEAKVNKDNIIENFEELTTYQRALIPYGNEATLWFVGSFDNLRRPDDWNLRPNWSPHWFADRVARKQIFGYDAITVFPYPRTKDQAIHDDFFGTHH